MCIASFEQRPREVNVYQSSEQEGVSRQARIESNNVWEYASLVRLMVPKACLPSFG